MFFDVLVVLWHAMTLLTRPSRAKLVEDSFFDLARSRADLMAENALLRQQLIILHRSVKRPQISRGDRAMLIVLARLNRLWRNALLIVQPETLLRWHRDLLRWVWWGKSKPKPIPRVPPGTMALLQQMIADNLTWGAERIRGELLKLNICLSKRTIQKYIRRARRRCRPARLGACFWITIRTRSGLATFCKPTTSCSGRCFCSL